MRGGVAMVAVSDIATSPIGRSAYRQATRLDGITAIAIARDRFKLLCAQGTHPPKSMAPTPVDAGQVELVMTILQRVGKTKTPKVFAVDIARDAAAATGRKVSVGAVIAAAVALNFGVRSWRGVSSFAPDAATDISLLDLRREIVDGDILKPPSH